MLSDCSGELRGPLNVHVFGSRIYALRLVIPSPKTEFSRKYMIPQTALPQYGWNDNKECFRFQLSVNGSCHRVLARGVLTNKLCLTRNIQILIVHKAFVAP